MNPPKLPQTVMRLLQTIADRLERGPACGYGETQLWVDTWVKPQVNLLREYGKGNISARELHGSIDTPRFK